MLFEKINLEKLTRPELVILFQALTSFNDNKNDEQLENFIDRVSNEIQSLDAKIENLRGEY